MNATDYVKAIQTIKDGADELRELLLNLRVEFHFTRDCGVRVLDNNATWQGFKELYVQDVFRPYLYTREDEVLKYSNDIRAAIQINFYLPNNKIVTFLYSLNGDCLVLGEEEYKVGSLAYQISEKTKLFEIFKKQRMICFPKNEFVEKITSFGERKFEFDRLYNAEKFAFYEEIKKEWSKKAFGETGKQK